MEVLLPSHDRCCDRVIWHDCSSGESSNFLQHNNVLQRMQQIPESKPIIVFKKKKWEASSKERGGSGAETIWQILQPSSAATRLKHRGGKMHHPLQCETRLHMEAEPLLARTYLTTLARLATASNRPTCLITGGIRCPPEIPAAPKSEGMKKQTSKDTDGL